MTTNSILLTPRGDIFLSKALDVYTHHQETSQANPRPVLAQGF